MTLDIIIPSYNRNEKIIRLLQKITDKRFDKNVFFKIIDNNSAIAIKDSIKSYKPELLENPNIKFFRNSVNIGLGGNIMRCFEYTESDWLWIVGDDDQISKESIDLVLNKLHNIQDDISFINFASPWAQRNQDTICKDLDDFISNLDSFQNSIYLPTTVYSKKEIQKHIEGGFKFINTLIPHFFLQLKSLDNGGCCILHQEDIFISEGAKSGGGWSVIDFQLNKNQILNYPYSINKASFRRLRELLVLDRQPLKYYIKKILKEDKYPPYIKPILIRRIFEENKMLLVSKSFKEKMSNCIYYLLSYRFSLLNWIIK